MLRTTLLRRFIDNLTPPITAMSAQLPHSCLRGMYKYQIFKREVLAVGPRGEYEMEGWGEVDEGQRVRGDEFRKLWGEVRQE